jgi:DDE superfamily endonuclease
MRCCQLCDALLCAPGPVSSIPRLSLEPVFRRSHGSLYKALGRGGIDAECLRQVLVEHRPADWPAVFAVDASTWERCDAETSPERGFSYHPSRHSAGQPIVAGWSYQWITQLCWAADSWTTPLDGVRLPPDADTATVNQVRDLVSRLGTDGGGPLFVFDAGYDAIALSAELAADRAAVLVRIRSDRVFYPDPDPAEPGRVDRPRRHGDRLACADPSTWAAPDDELVTDDPCLRLYGKVRAQT